MIHAHAFQPAVKTDPWAPIPFADAQTLWFWFIQAQTARHDGAKVMAFCGAMVRPCSPLDVQQIVARLYSQKILSDAHIRVMRHYGLLQQVPDPYRPQQLADAKLWAQAVARLSTPLIQKDIIADTRP